MTQYALFKKVHARSTTSCEKPPAFLTDRSDVPGFPYARNREVRPTATYERSELVSWADDVAPARRAARFTDRSHVSPLHKGETGEMRPTSTYERERISDLG